LDASVAASWCFADEAAPNTDALLDRVRECGAVVPTLWHWEVANIFATAARRGRISAADASAQLAALSLLPITSDPDSTARAWREGLILAHTHRLTAYDAAYLELASRLGLDLATKDTELAAAARAIGVSVFP
jgi:predicted nucleic acid-binding protein